MRWERKKLAQLVRLWASKQLLTAADYEASQGHVDNALAQWGLQAETPDDAARAAGDVATFYIWPHSLKTWALWQRLQTMWRSGMGGREGLDWGSVTAWLRHAERMPPKKIARTLHVLRTMEAAALDVWAAEREKQDKTG